jgi:hypothetical protein
MIRVGTERGNENEVLNSCIPSRIDKVPVAFEVNALRVILAPARQN